MLRIVAEPTAAAMAYDGVDLSTDQALAVYDLGAGTFDVSLLIASDGVVEVVAINGDTTLGGDDFDERIVSYLIDYIRQTNQVDLSRDLSARVRLKEAAEKAKIALSGIETVNIYVPFLYSNAGAVCHLDFELTRTQFAEMTADLVKKTIEYCRAAQKDAGNGWRTYVDSFELLLVGLSTKIPHVRQAVQDLFDVEPRRGIDPDEAVALGVAIQAGVISHSVNNVLLLDVAPKTLGIEGEGGVMIPIIERNTTIPTQKSETLSTMRDIQTSVIIHILQGESGHAHENVSLGKLLVVGVSPAPRGIPQIEVTFNIDQNGTLEVTATDKATRGTTRKTIHYKHPAESNAALDEDHEIDKLNLPIVLPKKDEATNS
ncbi:hypothetical protein CJ255_00315 [Candidatus Viridilinea mediisalina]|uniref:Molecular chaperone DnaK n=1 Tax=Candidatus Viridilinea mediisalina TaxID=2024553 RepID=A0A2A6RQ96_9CHLR|nr:hypothetical protein CJ255_00315 [Candidatus Viridilinea mediisalina]